MNKSLIIISSIVAVLSGAAIWGFMQYKKALDFCYKIKTFKINALNKDGFNFDLSLLFENKSVFSGNVTSYLLDVYINDMYLGNTSNKTDIAIKPKGISELTINVNLKPQQKLEKLINIVTLYFLKDYSNLNLIIKGTADFKALNLVVVDKLPIDLQFTFAELLAPTPPSQSVCNIK